MFVVAFSAIFLHAISCILTDFRKPCVITHFLLSIEVDFNKDRPETSASHWPPLHPSQRERERERERESEREREREREDKH